MPLHKLAGRQYVWGEIAIMICAFLFRKWPCIFVGTAMVVAFPTPLYAQKNDPFAALAQQDLRLASIAERLLIANAHLCRNQMPVTGMLLHSADQYADDVRPPEFARGPVAIAQVLPGSAADTAGLRMGDVVLALAGSDLQQLAQPAEGPLRDAVFDLMAQERPQSGWQVRVAREGSVFDIELIAPKGCLALFEITTEKSLAARSDGRVIQITYPLAALSSDDQLAVIFAHELAHSVLEHRSRLSSAGVAKGFFGEFGTNQQRNRQVEIEADRLMVHLLANAGFAPSIAPAFFRSAEGKKVTGGLLSFVYPGPDTRAVTVEKEIAMYLPLATGPSWPGHLLSLRDRPFAND